MALSEKEIEVVTLKTILKGILKCLAEIPSYEMHSESMPMILDKMKTMSEQLVEAEMIVKKEREMMMEEVSKYTNSK